MVADTSIALKPGKFPLTNVNLRGFYAGEYTAKGNNLSCINPRPPNLYKYIVLDGQGNMSLAKTSFLFHDWAFKVYGVVVLSDRAGSDHLPPFFT